MTIQAELANLKAERDRLRREIAEKNEQLGDQHQLQKELAQTRAQLQRRDQELGQANAALERARKRAREHRLKKLEENIRALQSGGSRLDASDGDWSLFPSMQLPPKIKVPEFQKYYGTTDPRHHLRHYRGKMLQYWDYEEFVIHTFQDSLAGATLDWYMSLKAADIPMWADLSSKFIDQYRYCAETPPTLLELSTMEMTDDQGFEGYVVKWRARAAKHVPPISEAHQIQLFHSTLKGAYYLHLLAHTSSFSNLIDAGKKLDIGIKLGKIEGLAEKKEGESSKRAATGTAGNRRGKDTPPTSRTPQPVQRAPAPQDQQGIATQTGRKQFTPLPAPLSHIYRQLLAGNKIRSIAPNPDFDPTIQNQSRRCEYYQGALGHTIDNCWKLRERIQQMIDDKQFTFNAVKPPNVQSNPLPDHGSSLGPSINMIGICAIGEYETGQEAPAPFKKVTEEEAEAFMKIIKASEYKVEEQMAKSPAHILLLALLLGSEPHREALLRVLTAAQIPKKMAPERIEETISSIFSNNISFLDDELPSEGLHSNLSLRRIDSNPSEELLEESRPIYFGEGLHEDGRVPEIEESLRRLENRQLTSVEPTEEINVGTEEEPRILKIGTGLDPTQRASMIEFLKDYQEVFAWSYADMPGLDPSIVKHFLPLDTERFPPKRQHLRRQCAGLLLLIKEEIIKQINAGFLEVCNYSEWDGECQKAFDAIKAYLAQPPVLVPPTPDRPLILYLTVRRQSLGCMLGQEDESTRVEHAIYYLSKKFTEGESNYSEIEKICCALVWVMQRLRPYTLYHTIRLLSKADPLKYLLDSPSSMKNISKWRCQLTEYDIEYVRRTSVKGQAIADHLAEFPIEDDTPINSNFPDERILQVDNEENKFAWKIYFDGAVNSTGSGIGAVLISPDGRYYPIAAKVDFPCTNNVAEYEACILGLQAAIDFKVKELEVFGDSMLTIFQTLGQWKTKDEKLVPYHEYHERKPH
ncbi:hypothetical protein CRG98_035785 [Punica granatum]|uniref:RNase H type-1 domain-containing protein n=1 Tax=Punica granatum TaxID=22663 RepID=A0A2I0IIM3_PUNGR|nr:hypothetical protein CRG98_035785 [Punica granatum]